MISSFNLHLMFQILSYSDIIDNNIISGFDKLWSILSDNIDTIWILKTLADTGTNSGILNHVASIQIKSASIWQVCLPEHAHESPKVKSCQFLQSNKSSLHIFPFNTHTHR